MIGTLLIDLDDTLLINPREQFLPAYLQALGNAMSPFIQSDHFIPRLLHATQMMVDNKLPNKTLREIFDATFYPSIGIEKSVLEDPINHFYTIIYPALKNLTSPKPGARRLIDQAIEAGYRIIIATNPVFPLIAIRQRLAWADLPVERYPFAFVASYETLHFAKPNPAYYGEILARIGLPDGPVIMIGESLEEDIFPSRRLGIAAYWTPSKKGLALPSGAEAPNGVGDLSDFLDWVKRASKETLQPDFSSPISCLALMRALPAALQSLTDNLSEVAWTTRPASKEWALNEIICHLRDVEKEVNLPRIKRILTEDNPFLVGLDTDQWAEGRKYHEQDGVLAFQEFLDLRLQLLEVLDSLSLNDWQRPARHTFYSRTNLAEIVRITANHERLHFQQFYKTLQEVLYTP